MLLVHSPDDGGWYYERDDNVQSRLYDTEAEARSALRRGHVEWEELGPDLEAAAGPIPDGWESVGTDCPE